MQSQHSSLGKAPDTCWKPSTVCSAVLLWFGSALTAPPCTALRTPRAAAGTHWGPIFACTQSPAEPIVSHHPLLTAARSGPRKSLVSSCCMQLNALQETLLLMSFPVAFLKSKIGVKRHRTKFPALRGVPQPDDLLALMQKGRQHSFPFFLPS